MKKKNLIRLCAYIAGMSLLAGTFTACGDKTVDYVVDGETANSSSDDETLALKYGIPEQCEKTLDTGDSGLTEISINDAEVTYPSTSGMDIVYYTKSDIANEKKQEIAENIFDTSEGIYEIDLENRTKSDIQQDIDYYEKMVQIYTENGMSDMAEEYQADLNSYNEAMENAPDEYQAAGDYSGSYYMGSIDGRKYTLNFSSDGIYFDPWDIDYKSRDDLENVAGYVYGSSEYISSDEINELTNLCSYTESEAQSIAEDFMVDVGIDDMILTETNELCWEYNNLITSQSELTELDGYVFTFARAVSNSPVATKSLSNVDNLTTEDGYVDIYAEECKIAVDSNGILYAWWTVYMKATGKTEENAELLSFDAMLEIANESVADYYTEYPTSYSEIEFNNVELSYYLSETEEDGIFKYVPAWIFTEYEEDDEYSNANYPNQMVVIDATDGSVIDLTSLSKALGMYYEYGE